jgi:hypothetical protein
MDLTLLLPFTIFAVSIFALTYVVRVVTADLFPALAAHAITRDLLTLVPTALGALVAYLALGFPYPEGFASTSGRLIFGLASQRSFIEPSKRASPAAQRLKTRLMATWW